MVAPSRAELFADHGVDEIGGALRQELELALRAVEQSLAEHAARADGDLRLDDVIAGAELVGFGIEQREDALLLVVVEHVLPGEPAGERRPRPASPKMMRNCSPAMITTIMPPMRMRPPVPRSGCRMVRPVGMQDEDGEHQPAT